MSTQKLNVSWQGKRQFLGTATNGQQTFMDGPPSAGGEDKGIRPMEMVLMGLAGCSAFDVVSILEKKKKTIANCEINVSAQRADAIPAVFEKIHLEFFISGQNISAKAAQQAVELSVDKYCSVAAMLKAGGVEITYEINTSE